jgi:hypothetical protein
MTESTTPDETLEEAVDRVQDTAHHRFKSAPGTDEHDEAIEAEIAADRDLNDEIQQRGSWPLAANVHLLTKSR